MMNNEEISLKAQRRKQTGELRQDWYELLPGSLNLSFGSCFKCS